MRILLHDDVVEASFTSVLDVDSVVFDAVASATDAVDVWCFRKQLESIVRKPDTQQSATHHML